MTATQSTSFNEKSETARLVESVFEDYRARETFLSLTDIDIADGGTVAISEEEADAFTKAVKTLDLPFTETTAAYAEDHPDDFEEGHRYFKAGADIEETLIERFDPLEFTVLTNEDASQTYTRILFTCGGPNVWAERGPFDRRFKVCAAWGGEYFEQTDWDDLLADYWDELIVERARMIAGGC